jgi:predicted alpha/beta superfamily hydrolase
VEWQADESATREIGQGRMREAIVVGIDNTDQRIPEYMPPNDSYQGTPGRGDAYASFVINNVRPYLDFNFRTLNDPKNTLTIGSSLGGLISLYFGREFSVFGKIGVMSPAFWIAPNYVTQTQNGSKKPIRVYLDFGTAEPASDWDDALSMYDVHLAQSYSTNDDVLFIAGCGQQHNETAWAARLPAALDYLLPAREEPNELLQREFPPIFILTGVNMTTGAATFSYTSFFGFTYALSRSPNLVDWSPLSSTAVETLPWANHSLGDSFPAGSRFFWKLTPTAAP